MLAEVYNDNGTFKFVTLAGAAGDGLPLGVIVPYYGNTIPVGFLKCDGSEYDTNDYPALYSLLGSNKTPDLRECHLVGVGQSTRNTIAAHDVYSVGTFKDDQVQTIEATLDLSNITATVNDPGHTHTITDPGHTHTVDNGVYYGTASGSPTGISSAVGTTTTNSATTGITIDSATTGITVSLDSSSATATFSAYRNGVVTRPKSVGVTYLIKATTGTADIDEESLYDRIIAFIELNYKTQEATDKEILYYDGVNDVNKGIDAPTVNGQVLKANITSASTTTVYVNGNDFYNVDGTATTEPIGTAGTETLIGDFVIYNGTIYSKNVNWYEYSDFITIDNQIDDYTALSTQPDYTDIQDGTDWVNSGYVLDNDTYYEIDTITYDSTNSVYQYQLNGASIIDTASELTIYEVNPLIDTLDSETEISISSVIYTYAGGEISYSWDNTTGTVAFRGTMAEWTALDKSNIPANSIVIITDADNYYLESEDA